jgi:hypothetical protein
MPSLVIRMIESVKDESVDIFYLPVGLKVALSLHAEIDLRGCKLMVDLLQLFCLIWRFKYNLA